MQIDHVYKDMICALQLGTEHSLCGTLSPSYFVTMPERTNHSAQIQFLQHGPEVLQA